MITAAIILLAGSIVFNVLFDYRIWLKEKARPHKKGWRLKAITALPAIVCFSLASNLTIWLAAPISALMCAFIFWLLFDGFYNILRGFGPFYLGTDDPDDAETDNLLQGLPVILGIFLKLALPAFFIWLYWWGYK